MVQESTNDDLKKALDVQTRYQNYLMSKPHVVGVAVGMASVAGVDTSEVAVIVMVDHKIPPQELPPADRIPSRLEGVRIDVQETGLLTAFGASTAQ